MKARRRPGAGALVSIVSAVGLVALALSPATTVATPGALDRSFGEAGRVVTQTDLGGPSWLNAHVDVAEGPEGTIVAAVGRRVFRYLPDGSLDPSFGDGGKLTIGDPGGMPFTLHDLVVDGVGRIYLLGEVEVTDAEVPFYYMAPFIHPWLAAVIRYTADGRLDSSFGGHGYVVTDLGQPSPYGPGAPYDKGLTTLTAGAAEPTGGLVAVAGVAEFPPSVGHSVLTTRRRLIVRLSPEGNLDPSFGEGDGVQAVDGIDEISSLAVSGRGEVAVGGSRTVIACAEIETCGVGLLRPDGEVDSAFGRSGLRALGAPAEDVALDRFGRAVVLLPGWRVLRLNRRGGLDRHFGRRGRAFLRLPSGTDPHSVLIGPSGRIVLAGTGLAPRPRAGGDGDRRPRGFTAVRLTRRGRLDRRFERRGWTETRFGRRAGVLGQDAYVDAEGRLIVAGPIARPDLAPTGGIALARYGVGG